MASDTAKPMKRGTMEALLLIAPDMASLKRVACIVAFLDRDICHEGTNALSKWKQADRIVE